jgi:myosin heavy subunit
MQEKIFKFNLDIKDREFKTDFNLVQLDNTSRLIIKLYDNGDPYETQSNDKAEIAIDKNDNTFVVLNAELYNNTVDCLLNSNSLAVPGWTDCEARILNSEKVLTSARFKIYIRENIVNNENVKSTSEYKALEGLINEAKIMQESLKKGETVIEDVNKIKEDLAEIKESILNKSKELNDKLASVDEKITEINSCITNAETVLNNFENSQNKIDNLSNLLKELSKIQLTLDELNKSINKANTKKTELDTSIDNANREKTELDSSVENSKTQNTNLKNTITEAETAESSLATSTQKGISQQSNLEKTIADSVKKNKILSDTNTKSETLNRDLNVLSQDLTNKITDGGTLNSSLAASISSANSAKSNLDGSISNAESTNTNLKATDTEAKNTESLIRDLMSQLNLTKDEVQSIIASGNLDQYITDPKLQEALKFYATKEDLSKIDVTGQLVDYAKKTEIPTKLSQLANDKTFKTEDEIRKLINDSKKLKKEVVTSLPSSGKEDIIYLLKNKNDNNNFYTEYLWIGSKWEIIGDTKIDLTDYAKTSDLKTKLSEMVSDSSHRTVTDTEKTAWNNKVDAVTGKGLSTNDYTDIAKSKVDAIPSSPKYTDTVTSINGKTGAISKADIVALGIPSKDTNTTYGLASQSSNGLMSAADKKRLDNIKEQVALTEAQYNALSSTQQNDSKKIYFIKA